MSGQIAEALYGVLGTKEQIMLEEPMSGHTTFRIGGPAKIFVTPEDRRELAAVLALCRKEGCPWTILGNGSNLLVSDSGFAGVVIQIGKGFDQIAIEGEQMAAGAGALLAQAARQACRAGLSGLEFATGIPGTIGGAVVMNAGAYGSEMKDILLSAQVLTEDGSQREVSAGELELGYRTSSILRNGWIVLGVRLRLQKGDPETIGQRVRELTAARKAKQPLEYPSAGSTFKRPEGFFAGKLIQDAGLKGFQIGGAQISEKHSGFVINRGGATASDVMELCRQVSEKVKAQSGVELEMEVKTLGEFR
ncbi:MAG: UDP-N-acetylmuramate dehydrogenase [Lachnospiraceae bacterium]|nr:UDP-N-acetylmuramate dehydrogenase [Lachnospiraceae bacterium]